MYYGLSNKRQVAELAEHVCDVIGHGSNHNAVEMLVETCAAETQLGTVRDRTLYGAGAGVSQIDSDTFYWLQKKFSPRSVGVELMHKMNIKLDKVQYNELDNSPLLALIFCRLRYWTVTTPIPTDMRSRAQYWKEHYNTKAGKGSPEEYIARCLASDTAAVLREVHQRSEYA